MKAINQIAVAALFSAMASTSVFAQEVIIARPPPPPPRVEVVPAARPGYVWAGGEWRWRGGAYAWAPGYWRQGRVCPPGLHLGPYGHRCLYNRP